MISLPMPIANRRAPVTLPLVLFVIGHIAVTSHLAFFELPTVHSGPGGVIKAEYRVECPEFQRKLR
jgi:hypothetical protein